MNRLMYFIVWILITTAPGTVPAQGTKADYERANALRGLVRNKVFRDRVEPNWSDDGQRLWYRVETDEGVFEFVSVDAQQGSRSLAFDHAVVAEKLASVTNEDVSPGQLPIKRLRFIDGNVVEFSALASEWAFDCRTGNLNELNSAKSSPSDETGPGKRKKNASRSSRQDQKTSRGKSSPDGRWTALERNHDLFVRSEASPEREEKLLGQSGADDSWYDDKYVFWSPDSQKLVAIRTNQGQEHPVSFVESAPDDQLQPRLHTHNYLKPGDRIPQPFPHLFHVDSMKEIPLDQDLFASPWLSPPRIEWSPDSSRFYFTYNQRGHQVFRVLAVDAETGEVSTVVNEQSDTFIDYAYKHYLKFVHESGELIWMSERDGWNHLYLIDLLTGEVKSQITSGEWVVRKVEHVDIAKRQLWFQASGIYPEQDPYLIHYARVNFDGSGLTLLTEGNGTHSVFRSPNREFFVDTWSRVDQPPVTELRRADTGQLVCELERADWTQLLKTGWKVPRPFVAKGRDDTTDIYGVVFLPTNFDESKRYPVIEKIYAGPHGSFVPKAFSEYFSAQAIAELGFIVVQIDGMGTSHRSKAFHDVCARNLGDSGFPDRIRWIRAAANAIPSMDLSPGVGIYGGSAGGQSSTRALLAFGDFYTVAVSDCGCHDNRMDKIWWNELWMGWPIGPHYEEQSNVTNAHRLTGKLFLTVGELDRNVDPASTMQVVDALIKADKDFDLLVVPGRGHGVGEIEYAKRRRRDFFVRHLMGVEPRSQ